MAKPTKTAKSAEIIEKVLNAADFPIVDVNPTNPISLEAIADDLPKEEPKEPIIGESAEMPKKRGVAKGTIRGVVFHGETYPEKLISATNRLEKAKSDLQDVQSAYDKLVANEQAFRQLDAKRVSPTQRLTASVERLSTVESTFEPLIALMAQNATLAGTPKTRDEIISQLILMGMMPAPIATESPETADDDQEEAESAE